MIFGCAHTSLAVARAHVERCLGVISQHPLFVRLQTTVAAEANAWLEGEDLSELHVLGEFLGALRFANTAERAIEGEHAKACEHMLLRFVGSLLNRGPPC
jgi:hypothetical protein